MRILFYLPVATLHWFDNILTPIIRRAAREAEVHIIIPTSWSETGITEPQLRRCIDLSSICWHILDGDDHHSYRTAPEAPEGLIDFVHRIDPDYTFCRSADIVTPAQFPGKVRHTMEADYPPLRGDGRPHSERIMLTGPAIFDHGVMPPLDQGQRGWLRDRMAPLWNEFLSRNGGYSGGRSSYLARTGLPADRKIIALPLESESATNFYNKVHSDPGRSDLFAAEIAALIDQDFLLAVTPHPLWVLQPPEIRDQIAATLNHLSIMDPGRVRVIREPGDHAQLTRWLIQYSDGVIVRDSKTLAIGAFFGKPCLRLSRFGTGDWMNAYSDLPDFLDDVRAGTARTAALDDALTWFGFHHANHAFVPGDPDETLQAVLDRVDRPVDPGRWEANLDRHRGDFGNWFARPLEHAA